MHSTVAHGNTEELIPKIQPWNFHCFLHSVHRAFVCSTRGEFVSVLSGSAWLLCLVETFGVSLLTASRPR